jgi:hypothetical protein
MSLEELEAIARAATPDRWGVFHMSVGAYVRAYPDTGGSTWIAECRTKEDAAHIAAFSPARVLAMLEIVRAAKYVAYSNGFDAALPDKQERLRTALAAFDELEGK